MTYSHLSLTDKTEMCKEFQQLHKGYSIKQLHEAFMESDPEVIFENGKYNVWSSIREKMQTILSTLNPK